MKEHNKEKGSKKKREERRQETGEKRTGSLSSPVQWPWGWGAVVATAGSASLGTY